MAVKIMLGGAEEAIKNLEKLSPENIGSAVKASAKRAALAARTAGTGHVRQIYTIRSGDMKERTMIFSEADGATLKVKGATESVKKYRANERKKGIFVAIKHGGGRIVPRSCAMNSGQDVQRRGPERFPLKGLHGPSVPQLFGNEAVMSEMQERAGEVFETRLYHEIGRQLGVV